MTDIVGLDDVYSGFRETAARLKSVPGATLERALAPIKSSLPAFFLGQVGPSGRDPASYRCYGGYGEPNRTFAKIPWVATCKRSVARTVQDGYFIVLLFREDMAGCWLSLNQGYTQYAEAFVSEVAARRQAQLAARQLARMVEVPGGFVEGPINLGATRGLGKGYEAGAIISRYYPAPIEPTAADLAADFLQLLAIYDRLERKVGSNIVALLPDAEGPYQAAASDLGKKAPAELPPIPRGPLLPQGNQGSTTKGGYRRNPRMATEALKGAQFRCERDAAHTTFTARKTGENFVEAHHLVPMGEQAHFTYSLDVPENILALCPTCHRFMHHGRSAERAQAAAGFFKKRAAGLDARGITISESEIRKLYRFEIEDD